MNPKEREEFKNQLLASLEETKLLAAETRRMADDMQARSLRIAKSSLTSVTSSESLAPTINEQEPSLAEMRAYIDKVKHEIEEQRKYDSLPWWKRILKARPTVG